MGTYNELHGGVRAFAWLAGLFNLAANLVILFSLILMGVAYWIATHVIVSGIPPDPFCGFMTGLFAIVLLGFAVFYRLCGSIALRFFLHWGK